MRVFVRSTLALAALIAAPAMAAGPFDGAWKAQPSAARLDPKPDVFALANGSYTCRTCAPSYTIAADGAFHAIPGHPYTDDVSLRIVDAGTVVLSYRKGGKVTMKDTATVSADGKTLTDRFEDMSAANGQMVSGTQTARRVATGAAGSHLYAGSWRYDPPSDVSDAALRFTIATDGNMLRYEAATGEHFDAVMGGPAVAVVGDLGHATIKVERLGDRAIRETFINDGKATAVITITLSADGATMMLAQEDLLHHTKSSFVAVRA